MLPQAMAEKRIIRYFGSRVLPMIATDAPDAPTSAFGKPIAWSAVRHHMAMAMTTMGNRGVSHDDDD
jgi:hypothetical protein